MDIKKLINFGIINIDKSVGPTSFSVSSFLRDRLKLNKTSHMGTLDPKVSGVLPVTLGRACKLAGFLISHDKGYIGVLHTHTEQNIKKLQALIDKHFTGIIKQTPPHKSAVKRAEREREVYSWKLLEEGGDKKNFLFYTEVEGGTYIRKLCSDLGEMIGGAHMEELRRTKAGIFDESKMYTLPEFDAAVKAYEEGDEKELKKMIIPAVDVIKKIMPIIKVEKQVKIALLTGKPLFLGDVIDKKEFSELHLDEVFAVYVGATFIEIARKISDHEMVAKPEFVYN